MPSWIPGSYLLREYARHVVAVEAHSGDRIVSVKKLDKSTWQCTGASTKLTFRIVVYALEQSVRGAYVDDRRAYFNGPCVFACSMGREDEPVELLIEPVHESITSDWRVATSMQPIEIDANGYGLYAASDYADLLDHPVEISAFSSVDFTAGGVPHRLVIAGTHDADLDRIATDLSQLCDTQIRFFGGAVPFDRYTFLGLAAGDGFGGLEHKTSSSLIFNRADLPKVGETGLPFAYQKFLGLCSHEYFHAWHVKRTRPAAFIPYRLNQRSYTRQLWVFEGITSYYQEVFLLRSGLLDVRAFLRRVGEILTRVYKMPGRFKQSVAQSSFDAWDVLYKPEPNFANSGISYYSKGALVALALDLVLRKQSDSKCSLDTLVSELWQRFGNAVSGVSETDFEALAVEFGGNELAAFFEQAVRGTEDLPLRRWLEDFGVELKFSASQHIGAQAAEVSEAKAAPLWLGATWRSIPTGLELTTVLDGGPLQSAGINPGDVIIAMDKLQLDARNVQQRLGRYQAGDRVTISAFRGDELIDRDVLLTEAPNNHCVLSLIEPVGQPARGLRKAWLGV